MKKINCRILKVTGSGEKEERDQPILPVYCRMSAHKHTSIVPVLPHASLARAVVQVSRMVFFSHVMLLVCADPIPFTFNHPSHDSGLQKAQVQHENILQKN